MEKRLFEYVVIWNPTKEQVKEGEEAKIIVPMGHMLSKDEKTVSMKLVRQIDEKYIDQLDQVQIAVRPF